MSDFDVRRYWEERLSTLTLESVGYRGLGEEYNLWLYRMKEKRLLDCLRTHRIAVDGRSILDIGAGIGFYVDFWRRERAGEIVGLDITEASVAYLRERYPEHSFHRTDVSAVDAPAVLGRTFDIVTAFDVLYHIVDDGKFEHAIANVAELCVPGGYFILSDNFMQFGDVVSLDYIRSRTLRDYRRVLEACSFEILGRTPVFHVMIPPADEGSAFAARVHRALRSLVSRASGVSPRLGGRVAYLLDSCLHALRWEGPSTELMICRRVQGVVRASTD
jgi:2-polyprenyl-3-methyl-5-hydroxy-6-metoxy-1,4-benzoquinol methylase